jgi:nucleoside-diphosphate-sugar epimerase
MKRIAILGAGGFVGARFVEFATLTGEFDVVPVIRSFKSAARLARFGQCWHRADAGRIEELRPAIAGCDAVVNLTLGDFDGLPAAALAIWDACAAEQVPLLVHLSSAEVFGRVEDPNLHDDSPLLARHWMAYARGKAAAELALRGRFEDQRVACVILRPGLIWGPRSPWVAGPASQMAAGKAFLFGGGRGICNLFYLDNLMHSIVGVIESGTRESGCYNVADNETTTWFDYYQALARELGVEFSTIHQLQAQQYRVGLLDRVEGLRQTALGKRLKSALSKSAKQRIKRAVSLLRKTPPTSGPVPRSFPQVTRSDWHLQNTCHKLPTAKFAKAFGDLNRYSFDDAMVRTGQWLNFAGFANLRLQP